jgi:hypothetical protein
MVTATPGPLERAMALAAALSGDRELVGLGGATPALAEAVRGAATALAAGSPGATRASVAAELAALVGARAGSAVRASRHLPGLRRLVATLSDVDVQNAGEAKRVLGALSALAGPGLAARLAELSVALLRVAAQGERWAVRLAALGGAKLCDGHINPRLAPALAWVSAALAHDRDALEALAAAWPPDLAAALQRAEAMLAQADDSGAPGRGAGAVEAKARLEEELRRHG